MWHFDRKVTDIFFIKLKDYIMQYIKYKYSIVKVRVTSFGTELQDVRVIYLLDMRTLS